MANPYANPCQPECNLATFYSGVQPIDGNLLRKYNFQGMEIYALLKSLNLTLPFLNSVCFSETKDPNPSIPSKLVVDSNQMLAIGYSHIEMGFPIVLSIFPGVEVVIRNGGKIVIFNDNSLVNYGELHFNNAALILESDDTARIINNGYISLKTSFLVGRGIIFNSGRIQASCYSKVSIGKEKGITDGSDTTNVATRPSTVTTLDFSENYSRLINAGYFQISSYSTFELEGSFLNGKGEVSTCFMDQLYGYLPSDFEYDPSSACPSTALFQLSSNSRFTFYFGKNHETEFMNDSKSFVSFDQDTTSVFRRLMETNSKNRIVNRGTITLNGEATFKSVNVDNYSIIQNTYSVDSSTTSNFNFVYAKTLFTSNGVPSKVCNISPESMISVAPTCTMFFDGYNIVNYGVIISGRGEGTSLNTSSSKGFGDPTEPNDIAELVFVANNINRNATFVFGYVVMNPSHPPVTFKNFHLVINAPKSICMIGKNSTLNSAGRPNVVMLNQGTIYNFGLLQVCRSSEILNKPDPFKLSTADWSIFNGGTTLQSSTAVLLVRRPNYTVESGGYIRSISALLSTGARILNKSGSLVITWIGYDRDVTDECSNCHLIRGITSTISGTGKVRILHYPEINKWEPECLQEYLRQQAEDNPTDYGY